MYLLKRKLSTEVLSGHSKFCTTDLYVYHSVNEMITVAIIVNVIDCSMTLLHYKYNEMYFSLNWIKSGMKRN